MTANIDGLIRAAEALASMKAADGGIRFPTRKECEDAAQALIALRPSPDAPSPLMEAAMAVEIKLDEKALDIATEALLKHGRWTYEPGDIKVGLHREEAAVVARAYLTALRPSPSSDERVTDLLEALDRGVVGVGMHEDNDTELFDVDGATETMFEAAQLIRARLDLPGDERVDLRDSVIEECARIADAVAAKDEAHWKSAGRDEDAKSHYLWAMQTSRAIADVIRSLRALQPHKGE